MKRRKDLFHSLFANVLLSQSKCTVITHRQFQASQGKYSGDYSDLVMASCWCTPDARTPPLHDSHPLPVVLSLFTCSKTFSPTSKTCKSVGVAPLKVLTRPIPLPPNPPLCSAVAQCTSSSSPAMATVVLSPLPARNPPLHPQRSRRRVTVRLARERSLCNVQPRWLVLTVWCQKLKSLQRVGWVWATPRVSLVPPPWPPLTSSPNCGWWVLKVVVVSADPVASPRSW